MKILLIVTSLGMGGAEHVVVNLADALVDRGHQVKIVYLAGDALVLPGNSNIDIISLKMQGSKDLFRSYLNLRNIVVKFKPDIVHGHMFHANILSRLLRLSIKIPRLITTVHSTNEGGSLRMLAYRFSDQLADISTNVSDEAVDAYIRKNAVKLGRMISIPNGINTNDFYFDACTRESKRAELSAGNKKIIISVGSLVKAKDYPNLLTAISLLKDSRQDFKVFIVGDGFLKKDLNVLLKKLVIEDFVVFLGIRRDIKELMSAADIYVMSSAWEGLPMVILEAMACERFIVATDCGGVREAVGLNGLIVETENHTQLSSALNKALDMNQSERSDVGAAARQRVIDKYSLNTNVNAYLDLYQP